MQVCSCEFQRCGQNIHKHLRRRDLQKAVNCCCKVIHVGCLRGLCYAPEFDEIYKSASNDCQKQPFANIPQNRSPWKFRNISRETPVLESLFFLQACKFIKRRLQHMCFPVNIEKFLRTSFFTKRLRWLLLDCFWMILTFRNYPFLPYLSEKTCRYWS